MWLNDCSHTSGSRVPRDSAGSALTSHDDCGMVRQALAHARRREPLGDVEKKLAAVRAAAALNLGPEADIETMLAEIERGYLSDRSFDTD